MLEFLKSMLCNYVTTADFCKSCSCYACLNGGTCFERNGLPSCNCPSRFEGSHCHQKMVGGKNNNLYKLDS